MKTRIAIFLTCLVGVFALAAPAFAASPSGTTYNGVLGTQSFGGGGNGNQGVQTQATTSNSGGLPFTGEQVGLVLAGGVLLLGTGLVMRRASTWPR